MFPYIVLSFYIFISSGFSITNLSQNLKKKLFLFSSIILILFSGLSYQIGVDYFSYSRFFNEVPSIQDILNGHKVHFYYEPLYVFFNILVKSISSEFQIFVFVSNLVILFFVSRSLMQYSPLPLLSLLMYFVYAYFTRTFVSVLRQGLSESIFLMSLPFIIERKFIKFFFINLLAIGFHNIAILMLPIYWISSIKFPYKFNIGIGLLFLSLSIGLLVEMGRTADYLFILFDKSSYLLTKNYTGKIGFTLGILERLLFALTGLYFFNKTNLKNNYYYPTIFKIYFVSVIMYFLLNSVQIIATRGSEFLDLFKILMIPFWFVGTKKTDNKIVMYFVIIALLLYVLIKKASIDYMHDCFIPYQTIF